jgi:hypothetical protein
MLGEWWRRTRAKGMRQGGFGGHCLRVYEWAGFYKLGLNGAGFCGIQGEGSMIRTGVTRGYMNYKKK